MIRTLVIYESKYGFTKKKAEELSLLLGPSLCTRSVDFEDKLDKFDLIVICTPVYKEKIDSSIINFISQNAGELKKKKVALVCVCMATELKDTYLSEALQLLGSSVKITEAVKGEINVDKLSAEDSSLLKEFCKGIGKAVEELPSSDKIDFRNKALNIKKVRDKGAKPLEKQKLKEYMDSFIKSHNTCALATSFNDAPRATPVEYVYMNNAFYIISEGGEKFLNIGFNSKVGITVFDSYKSMNELAGMQIEGEAEVVSIASDEYYSVFLKRGIDKEKLRKLPLSLNLLKINVSKIEFLWSEFGRMGYDIKQIL